MKRGTSSLSWGERSHAFGSSVTSRRSPLPTVTWCDYAGQYQDASNFHRDKKAGDGLARYCKSCIKAYKRERYRKSAEVREAKKIENDIQGDKRAVKADLQAEEQPEPQSAEPELIHPLAPNARPELDNVPYQSAVPSQQTVDPQLAIW
jgi:hypothetical protein